MNRNDLQNILLSQLSLIDGGTAALPSYDAAHVPLMRRFESNLHGNVYSRFRFLDELNDFPCLCFYIDSESFKHIGGGIRYRTAVIVIRGYVYSDSDSSDDSEALLSDIEWVVSHIRLRNRCIIDARILSIGTDGGVLSPYGVSEAILSITYEDF
jgi:hypothetical protein